MSYIEWSNGVSTGVPEMDAEHKQLIDLINKMHDLYLAHAPSEEIVEVLNQLLVYGQNHFSDEEAYMQKMGIEGWEKHQQVHNHLIDQAVEIRDKLVRGEVGVSMETFKFLQDWLIGHILGTDRKHYGVKHIMAESTNDIPAVIKWFLELTGCLIPEDAHFVYVDSDGAVAHLVKSSHFPYPVNLGDNVRSASLRKYPFARLLSKRTIASEEGGASWFDVPCTVVSTPLEWDNQFYGVVVVTYPVQNHDALKMSVRNLSEQFSILMQVSRETADGGAVVASHLNQIGKIAEELQKQTSALIQINSLITEVASQTNLLGLNALIEAARAGESGRGFAVVAEEIQKLSTTTKDSSKKVVQNVSEILDGISRIRTAVQETTKASETQVSQLREASATMEHVLESAKELKTL